MSEEYIRAFKIRVAMQMLWAAVQEWLTFGFIVFCTVGVIAVVVKFWVWALSIKILGG